MCHRMLAGLIGWEVNLYAWHLPTIINILTLLYYSPHIDFWISFQNIENYVLMVPAASIGTFTVQ